MDELLVAADVAMYQSKKNGKNCITICYERLSDHDSICLTDEYLTGIEIIDEQHIKLTQLVNDLCCTVKESDNDAGLITIFSELSSFTQHHFATEHNLMDKHAYPGQKYHDEMHRFLFSELQDLSQRKYTDGKHFLVDHLKQWLLKHILEEDKPLAEFLSKAAN